MDAESLASIVTAKTGVELTRGGLREALDDYGQRRWHELGLSRFEEYKSLLDAPDGRELRRLIEIISVPHTWFFRDKEQLDLVRELLAGFPRRPEPLSIWIPGCASGEDAYSVALIAAGLGLEAKIVGSDLCERSLSIARRGMYSPFSLRALPAEFRSRFRPVGRSFQISEDIKRSVTFESHNLLLPALNVAGGWHLILCRNVFIYFSKSTARDCAARLGRALHDTGLALFGAGELIGMLPQGLEAYSVSNRVIFRRRRGPESSAASQERTSGEFVVPSERHTSSVVPVRRRAVAITKKEEATFERARAVLSTSSEAPTDPQVRMMSGIALYSAGDLDRSLHELRAASLLDAQLWPAAIYQGMCLESMGLPDLARAEYRHAVQVLESSPDVHAKLPKELEGLAPELLEMARRKSA